MLGSEWAAPLGLMIISMIKLIENDQIAVEGNINTRRCQFARERIRDSVISGKFRPASIGVQQTSAMPGSSLENSKHLTDLLLRAQQTEVIPTRTEEKSQ